MQKNLRKIYTLAMIILPVITAAKLAPEWINIIIPAISSLITNVFIRLLQLVSLPIVFLSITTTLLKQDHLSDLKKFGISIIRYTLATTIAASLTAAILYRFIQPHRISMQSIPETTNETFEYGKYLISIIPDNFFAAFVEQNVIGVMIMAFGFGIAAFGINRADRQKMAQSLDRVYQVIFSATNHVLKYLPIVIWAFYADLVHQAESIIPSLHQLSAYVMCVVSANLIHACITLPFILFMHGIPTQQLFNSMKPALNIAFWSKSSNAALPSAISCLSESGVCSHNTARISMPLCISINMNACAAFILITVHFVAQLNGVQFSLYDSLAWVLIATLAAIGNAGVPMGCYFLAGALLTSFNIPLEFMGIILPIYGLIDMLESAINVWSDACVSSCVEQTIKSKRPLTTDDSTIVPIR